MDQYIFDKISDNTLLFDLLENMQEASVKVNDNYIDIINRRMDK